MSSSHRCPSFESSRGSSLGSSRRSFLQLAGLAATFPLISEGHLARAAQQAAAPKAPDDFPHITNPNAVMINANENPLGPCDAALAAITTIARTGGRYDATGCEAELTAQLAAEFGVPANHLAIYAGSSEPLQFATLAFTSPTRSYVTADPSYEAGMVAANAAGAKVIKVPLTRTYAHDVRAMIAADPNAGVIYICSPNNPTGTLTPKDDILWALEHKPAGSILLVDEAYIHLSGSPSVTDQVALGKDIVVLRTFSKIYGMAGIRCGVAFGRPDLLEKLSLYGRNPLPVTAIAAASASLKQSDLVPTRRKIVTDTRTSTFVWLDSKGYKYIPSVSNCFMIDTGRPGRQVMAAMRQQDVYIGRTWPVWPTYVRITVGTPHEMELFQTAFEKVMTTPVSA
ncbi:pyridoxal phosphate-dependent aminotransferase [Granulicella sp. L46]|uniref:pyridoxal phosphate-dependent aminotransferase n=1 Tax=Granulicella sp. L46 TaxID=1641865 RepID=UPI00131B56D0|nr:pyridoxal phosphate-dependent aminotransferase [Granulicella sp. L46]